VRKALQLDNIGEQDEEWELLRDGRAANRMEERPTNKENYSITLYMQSNSR
jgi:hypothetical protein